MIKKAAAAALAALLLASCETVGESAAQCGGGEAPIVWTILETPPVNAAVLNQRADAQDRVGNRWSYWRSIWYAGPEGEIMLCRVGSGFLMSQTWIFDREGNLTDDGSIVLRGD